MLKSSVLEQIDSLPHLKRGTLPLRSVWSLRDDKRETVLRPGLLAQLAERGADNADIALHFEQVMKAFSNGHQVHIATKVPTQKARVTPNDFGLTERESLDIIVWSA